MAMDSMRAKAKMAKLKELKKMMRDDMYEPMKEKLSKVTIMSDSKEGLEKGLDKAKELLNKRMKMKKMDMEDEESMEDMMEDMNEDEGEEESEYTSGGLKKKKGMKYRDGGFKSMFKKDKKQSSFLPMESSESLGEGDAYYPTQMQPSRFIEETKTGETAESEERDGGYLVKDYETKQVMEESKYRDSMANSMQDQGTDTEHKAMETDHPLNLSPDQIRKYIMKKMQLKGM